MNIIPDVQWKSLIEDIRDIKGISMIIGATDSGKSSLLKYLLNELLRKKITISVIDADVGQSSLGLPGTICMKIFFHEHEPEKFTFEKMSFIGTVNPAMNMPAVISITGSMSIICREKSDITLIDTSGLISGETGRTLKILKIKTIKPEHIIALQIGEELEHILTFADEFHIHRIPLSRMVKSRSREERILYRKIKFREYFDKYKLNDFLLSKNSIRCYYKEKYFIPKYADYLQGTLIGLNHDDETKALGIVNEIGDDSIIFASPINSMKNINKIIFGDIKF
jgi:polynucleotide 5'-hydroxyl-kinase GRC3/NOL9